MSVQLKKIFYAAFALQLLFVFPSCVNTEEDPKPKTTVSKQNIAAEEIEENHFDKPKKD